MKAKNTAFASVFCASVLTTPLTAHVSAMEGEISPREETAETAPPVSTDLVESVDPAPAPAEDVVVPEAPVETPVPEEVPAPAPETPSEEPTTKPEETEKPAPEVPESPEQPDQPVKPETKPEPTPTPDEDDSKDEKPDEKDEARAKAKAFVQTHGLKDSYLTSYLKSFNELQIVKRDGIEYYVLPGYTEPEAPETLSLGSSGGFVNSISVFSHNLGMASAARLGLGAMMENSSAASQKGTKTESKKDEAEIRKESKTSEVREQTSSQKEEKETKTSDTSKASKTTSISRKDTADFVAADYESFFKSYYLYLHHSEDEKFEINLLIDPLRADDAMNNMARTAVASVNMQSLATRRQFVSMIDEIRTLDPELGLILPGTSQEISDLTGPVEEIRPGTSSNGTITDKLPTVDKDLRPAGTIGGDIIRTELISQTVNTVNAVTEQLTPTTGRIHYNNLGHGQNRLINIPGIGTMNLLPDFTNAKAWKGSVSAYNTPYLWGQCTWFAWGRFYEIYGFNPGFTGNGYDCAKQLAAAHPDKFELSKRPVAGAVFSGDTAHNHVGIVLEYDEETELMTIQEGNLDGVSNYIWKEAIEDYRTIQVTPAQLNRMYGNVTYAVPKAGAYKKIALENLKSKSLRDRVLEQMRAAFVE